MTPNSARSPPVDVRLNKVSQPAEFSKRDESRIFLREICHIDNLHLPVLAPSADILAAFEKHKKDWPDYELAFLNLMRKRQIEKQIDPAVINGGLLHCSQATPPNPHRRLVMDHLTIHWGYFAIQHLD